MRRQLALVAASAMFTLIVFALITAFIMILVTTLALTLRAASALTLLAAFALTEGFFNLNKVIKRMSECFKDSF